MKTRRLNLAITVLIVFFGINAAMAQQWANNGTHIYNTNSGNVGIGTGTSFTPTSKLHINNGSTVADIMLESAYSGTSNHSVGNLRLKNTTTGDMFNVTLRKNGTVDEMLQSCFDASASLWREFIYYNYGTRKYEMRNGVLDAEFKNSGNLLFNMTGNVGIKTSSPAANLHVAQTTGAFTAAFGTPISYYNSGTNVSIGDDTHAAVLFIGQDNYTNAGLIYWNTSATPSSRFFSVCVPSGGSPLILQEVGGNVGIHTYNPQAALQVKYDDYGDAKIGYTMMTNSMFSHYEDPANGDGQSAIYGFRSDVSTNHGTSYNFSSSNSAICGYNFYGDSYTFGTVGFTWYDYVRTGGVLGANYNGNIWGALGYNSSGSINYGGYFTNYTAGAGKSSGALSNIGIGSWGDMMGADIHGKIYGEYVEGKNFATYSHGVTYKDNLDVHLQKNDKGSNTVMYTSVSTDATVQTSGVAVLSSGKASITFDQAFSSIVSDEEPVIVAVTPLGKSNGVYLSQVSSNGFSIVENNDGKSNVTVNYIAVGKRAGYEKPQLAKEVVDPAFVSKLSRGLHNDNDLQTNGEGLYYENGELKVGVNPSANQDKNKPAEPKISKTPARVGGVLK
jgi:hypothetical protein